MILYALLNGISKNITYQKKEKLKFSKLDNGKENFKMVDSKKVMARMEALSKEPRENTQKQKAFNPIIAYYNEKKSRKEIAARLLEVFYQNEVIDGKVETSKLYLGTLTFEEGDPDGMLLGYNDENNVDEKCILYPVIKTPHNGTVFLDIINETLIETKCGFNTSISGFALTYGPAHKAGVLVESGGPLNEAMNKEVAKMDEIKAFVNEINKQKQKTKKF